MKEVLRILTAVLAALLLVSGSAADRDGDSVRFIRLDNIAGYLLLRARIKLIVRAALQTKQPRKDFGLSVGSRHHRKFSI